MRRTIATVTMAALSLVVLAGCGSSDYCNAVEHDKKTISGYGTTATDAAYARYAEVFGSVATKAPNDVAGDWKTLSARAKGVFKAQKNAGIKFEDMKDSALTGKLKPADIENINAARTKFNETTKERAAVVKNIKQECKISLK